MQLLDHDITPTASIFQSQLVSLPEVTSRFNRAVRHLTTAASLKMCLFQTTFACGVIYHDDPFPQSCRCKGTQVKTIATKVCNVCRPPPDTIGMSRSARPAYYALRRAPSADEAG